MPSSVVAAFKYNATRHILRITYVSGKIYDYKNVPESIYNEMKEAPSKGTFLNNVIKRNYAFKKVK